MTPFLRPPRRIVVYQNRDIIFVSAFEANWLLGRLKSKKSPFTTLRLLLPRTNGVQSIFINTSTLTIPPLINFPPDTTPFDIPIDWLVQLFVFNGTLYFETINEQTAYCQHFALCPKLRTKRSQFDSSTSRIFFI